MNSDWRERYRVRISLIFGLIFIWRAQPRYFIFLLLGLMIAFSGVLLRQWAAGTIKKMDELAVTGPYAMMRHPLYVGSFLLAFGFLLAATTFWPFIWLERTLLFWSLFWILIDSFYFPKLKKEEKQLAEKFGERYAQYSTKVRRFLPRDLNLAQFNFQSFNFALWLKNKEYWGWAIYLLMSAILIARYSYSQ